MRAITVGLALAASLALLHRAAAAEEYVIDRGVWGAYQEYLRNIGNGIKPGAFAITTDGFGAYYTWCKDTRCRVVGASYSQLAVSNCEREYRTECVVFAVLDEIRAEYEILGD
jgi:hypothetical protein